MNFFTPLVYAMGVTFLTYGVLCLFSLSMVQDFHRFGLEPLRRLTGLLELLGGSGLLVGLKWPPALSMASAGLSLLMLIAFGVRMKMHDSVALSTPSFVLMILSAYICARSLRR